MNRLSVRCRILPYRRLVLLRHCRAVLQVGDFRRILNRHNVEQVLSDHEYDINSKGVGIGPKNMPRLIGGCQDGLGYACDVC
jgi:hypothetical protein